MGCRDDVNTSGESGHGIVNKAIAHESEIDNIINLNEEEHGWSLV